VDDSRTTLVWRFPRYQNQIKQGAQLIVRPGQTAVFVHQGKIADVFQPGRYTLETKNLPVLATLAGWKFGFDSPIKAEIYFVATRQITDLKWGTPNPVLIRDPDFGPIRVRAFGTFTLKAVDPKALLQELVGTDSIFEAEEVAVLLRSIVAQAFADLVATSEMSVIDLAGNQRELAEKLRNMVKERVDDEYGLDVPQLFLVNVSVPEEVEKALDARSSMKVIDDLASYQQYQIGAATKVAAANPAGGIAAGGIGMGMGLAMANRITPQGPTMHPTPRRRLPPPAWHVVQAGQGHGPFTLEDLQRAAQAGTLRADTLVWTAGMATWSAASRCRSSRGCSRGRPERTLTDSTRRERLASMVLAHAVGEDARSSSSREGGRRDGSPASEPDIHRFQPLPLHIQREAHAMRRISAYTACYPSHTPMSGVCWSI
jgi:membrane protease subunit (stomatin/prohibitin family)